MADIRIRQVDSELHRGLKKSAVDAGLSLEEYCRRLLEGRGVEGNAKLSEGQSSGIPHAVSGTSPRESSKSAHGSREQVSSPAAPPDIEDDEPAPHDPEFCQQPGCRECRKLREGTVR